MLFKTELLSTRRRLPWALALKEQQICVTHRLPHTAVTAFRPALADAARRQWRINTNFCDRNWPSYESRDVQIRRWGKRLTTFPLADHLSLSPPRQKFPSSRSRVEPQRFRSGLPS